MEKDRSIQKRKSRRALGSAMLTFVLLAGFTSSCYWRVNEMEKEEPVPEEVSFSNDIVPIFETGCTTSGCHNGTVPPQLTEDVAYNNLVLGGYVNTNDPSNSKIYTVISAGGSMEGYASNNDRAFILAWIEQGAKNN